MVFALSNENQATQGSGVGAQIIERLENQRSSLYLSDVIFKNVWV